DITVEAWLKTRSMTEPVRLSLAAFKDMYWTLGQMVAHHTSNGCPIRPGDVIGTGTISGPERENRGCLLERTWKGTEPVTLPGGGSGRGEGHPARRLPRLARRQGSPGSRGRHAGPLARAHDDDGVRRREGRVRREAADAVCPRRRVDANRGHSHEANRPGGHT